MDPKILVGVVFVGLIAFLGGLLIGARRRSGANEVVATSTSVLSDEGQNLEGAVLLDRIAAEFAGPGSDAAARDAQEPEPQRPAAEPRWDGPFARDLSLGRLVLDLPQDQESVAPVEASDFLVHSDAASEQSALPRSLDAASQKASLITPAPTKSIEIDSPQSDCQIHAAETLGAGQVSDEPKISIDPPVVIEASSLPEATGDAAAESLFPDSLWETVPDESVDDFDVALEAWPDWFIPDLPLVAELGPGRRYLPDWAIADAPLGVWIGEFASAPRGSLLFLDKTHFGERITLMHPPVDPRGGRSPYDICRGRGASRYWADQDREHDVDDDTYVIVVETDGREFRRPSHSWISDDPIDDEISEYDSY